MNVSESSSQKPLPSSEWPVVSPEDETLIQEHSKSPAYKVKTRALIEFFILRHENPSPSLGYLASLGLEYIEDPLFQRMCLQSQASPIAKPREQQLIPANFPAGERARWENVIVGLQRIQVTLSAAVYVAKHPAEILRSLTTAAAGATGILTSSPMFFGVALCQLAAGLSGLRTLWQDWYGEQRPAEHFLETMSVGTDSLLTFNKVSHEVIKSLSEEVKELEQRSHHLEALRRSIQEGMGECAAEIKEVLQATLGRITEIESKLQEANRIVMEADEEERNFSASVQRMHNGLVRIKAELEEKTEGPVSPEKIEAFVQQISGYEESIRGFLTQAAGREEKRAQIRKYLAEANEQQVEMTKKIVDGIREFGKFLGNIEEQLEAQGDEVVKLNDTILKLRVKQMELLFLNRCEKAVLQLMQKEIDRQRGSELQKLLSEYGVKVDEKVLLGITAGTLVPGGLLIKALAVGVISQLLAPPQAAKPEKTTVTGVTTPFEVRFEFGTSRGAARVVNFLTSLSINLRNTVRNLDVSPYMPEALVSASATAVSYFPSLPGEPSPIPLSRTQGNLILRLGDQQMGLPINFNIEKNLTLGAVQTIALFAKECLHTQKCSALELLSFLQQVTYLKIDRGNKGQVERLIPSEYVVLFAPLLLEVRGALHQFDPRISSLPETQVSRLMLVDSPSSSPPMEREGTSASSSSSPDKKLPESPF